jgi:hypothetical protein
VRMERPAPGAGVAAIIQWLADLQASLELAGDLAPAGRGARAE